MKNILGNNHLGVLKSSNTPSRSIESFTYDLHGWPKSYSASSYSGGTIFSESLRYASPQKSGSVGLLSGMVSEYQSQLYGGSVRTYDYFYDNASRLLNTAHYNGNTLSLTNTEKDITSASTPPSTGILEKSDYLPFGTRVATFSTPLNRWRQSGKEEQVIGGNDLGVLDFGARHYDPWLARWTSQDPMAAKYTRLSPYSYCAGNPVNVIDPQGDTLYVENRNTTLMFKDGIYYNSDGSVFSGKIKGYLKRVNNALSAICQTETGRSIIRELETAHNTFTISYGESNSFAPNKAIDAGANIPEVMSLRGGVTSTGTGGNIYWNPYNDYGGVDVKGNTKRPSFIGLIHEMAHASDTNRGLLHFSSNFGTYSAFYLGINRAEWCAVSIENRVRAEAGIPLRAYYSRTEDGQGSGTNMLLFFLINHIVY